MVGWLGILVGGLAAAGTALLLQNGRVSRALGLMLMSHAANLLVFTMAGAQRLSAPLIRPGESVPPMPSVDPLPQALVLTALVIGFALQAYALVLLLVPADEEAQAIPGSPSDVGTRARPRNVGQGPEGAS